MRLRTERSIRALLALALVGIAGCDSEPEPEVGASADAVTVAETTNASNFNGTAIASGRHIWFSSVVKVSGLGAGAARVFFTGSHIEFTADGERYDLIVPAGELLIDPAATVATTSFDAARNRWLTVIPRSVAGKNMFLTGLAFRVPVAAGLPGGIKPVAWKGRFTTDTPGLRVSWQWAASVYTQFSTNGALLGVKPTDDNQASAYRNSDHAGTPESFKAFVTGGARGGGGSNYTGSLSGTVSLYPAADLCADVVCTAIDPCHGAGTCDPATGACSSPNLADGTACDDGDACTETDVCLAGACAGDSPDLDNDPANCGACGNVCPAGGTCQQGACVGCGDGSAIEAEECDDGNLVDGDGCSATCTIEDGFVCTRLAAFGSSIDFVTGTGPNDAAIGDLNGDGRPDVVTANRVAGSVTVLLTDGAGPGLTRVDYPVGVGPRSVSVADLDGDARPDLAVTDSEGFVSVLKNVGGGGFAARVAYPVGPLLRDAAVADLDGDGDADLAAVDSGGTVRVLLGSGAGSFGIAVGYVGCAAGGGTGVAAADLNGDGTADLVVSCATSNRVGVLLGNGDGTFGPAASWLTSGSGPESVVIADLNLDEVPDLVVANAGGTVSLLLGAGEGTFPTTVEYVAALSSLVSVAAADLNGDGRLDLVTSGQNEVTVNVLSGNSTGDFATRLVLPVAGGPGWAVVADFDGDGRPDLAVANLATSTVGFRLGRPGASFCTRIPV